MKNPQTIYPSLKMIGLRIGVITLQQRPDPQATAFRFETKKFNEYVKIISGFQVNGADT